MSSPLSSQKIVLVGDHAVGKTCLLTRWTESAFDEATVPTIGCACITRQVVIDQVSYPIQFWDTAGQEIYQSMVPIYARGASGAMVVFDLTRRSTFESIDTWVRFASNPQTALILIGNKSDLEKLIQVSVDEAREAADRFHCPFFCTSAQTGLGVDDAFFQLVKRTVEPTSSVNRNSLVCDGADASPGERSGCC
jgi:small GTP-binding protein